MRLLLDANALIWAVNQPEKLSDAAALHLSNPSHERWLSVGTIWEIAIKVGLGKLTLNQPIKDWLTKAIGDLAIDQLSISVDHVAAVSALPRIHGDPFDRLLVAQAQIEKLEILSSDAIFDQYGVTRIW